MQTIVITGATDGRGLALARHYHERQRRVLLIGRRPVAVLQSPMHAPLFNAQPYCQADLSDSDCSDTIASWLAERGVASIDVLVHNAALGYYGAVGTQSDDSIRELMSVNVHAPMAITRALMPLMSGTSPQLVFVSSVASVLPVPLYAVYGATKAALESFAANLRVELGARIRIQIVVPGATRTAMHVKSGVPESVMQRGAMPEADDVARAIASAITRRSARTTIDWRNWLLRNAGRAFPRLMERAARGRSA
ncbi:MAG: SDR family NAD(P)-dependent oxidoreductase [Gemmatimonadaceae bacterium]